MLGVAGEHWIYVTDCVFDAVRRVTVLFITPHSFDKFCVIFNKFAFGPNRIDFVDLLLKKLLQKIIG